jgi:hypothetical protein
MNDIEPRRDGINRSTAITGRRRESGSPVIKLREFCVTILASLLIESNLYLYDAFVASFFGEIFLARCCVAAVALDAMRAMMASSKVPACGTGNYRTGCWLFAPMRCMDGFRCLQESRQPA